MSTLLKLGLSGFDIKPRFGAFQCKYLLQNPLFFLENFLVTLDTHARKMNPPSKPCPLVHGKACWLIAYKDIKAKFYIQTKLCRSYVIVIPNAWDNSRS